MRTSTGALLIVLGLLALWLAITGRFDRMAAAWDYVRGATDALPAGGTASAGSALPALEAVAALPSIVSLSAGI